MSDILQAYCFTCKTKRDIVNPQAGFNARNAPITTGTCPVCGGTLYRIGATAAHAGLTPPALVPAEKVVKPAKKAAASSKTAAKSATASKPGAKTSKTAAKSAVSSKTTTKTAASPKKDTETSKTTTKAAASPKKDTKTSKTTTKATKTTTKAAGSSKTAPKSDASKNGSSTSSAASGKLVIVESPAKARSVGQYLGKGYVVKASKGHVRDLLRSQLSVDVDNDFEPKYRVINDRRDTVKELKSAAMGAREIYLATDPDREGEAIAWHLLAATELNGETKSVKRVVFHEITRDAVQEAFQHPREIDINLVNAQQARRILDRLVGYNISPLLWEKVRNGLSAGRVQSIALRIIVEREREIAAFVQQEYWTLDARLRRQAQKSKDEARPFLARLLKIGQDDIAFAHEGDVQPHLAILRQSVYEVMDVKHGERQRKPSAPFTTSTLQQEASRRLGFTAGRTMSVAQQLYEGIELGKDGAVGLITYMRTDSTNVSAQAQGEARAYIEGRFGKSFIPASAPIYKTKAKGAQEAHEAIRPTLVTREPNALKAALTSDQFKLYTLIWQRFVASQMANAVYNTLRVEIDADQPSVSAAQRAYHFRVSGSTIKFAGFLALYEDARDEDIAVDEDEGRILPNLHVGDLLDLLDLLPEQHFTQPPPRYTEASLVRTLEEYGIGRPSTYAPIVGVIQDREYVTKKDKRLTPTETGKTVNDILAQYFADVMDYSFTARMEDKLDEIAEGRREWRPMLSEFYTPFEQQLDNAQKTLQPMQREELAGRDCPVCGNPLVIRFGRFGKFIGCSDYPNCKHTEPWLERIGVGCPTCGAEHGGELIVRRTRKGRTFYGCSRYPECQYTSWKRPLPTPCPNCNGMLVEQNRTTIQCTVCNRTYPASEIAPETPELVPA
jgi:DNA topoisomerase-1